MVVPRIGLATAAEGPEPSIMALAMLAGFTERRLRVQHFRTRACPTANEVVGEVTGLPGRHLDSWLMPEDVCRSLFLRGMMGASLALVEGTLQAPLEAQSCKQSDLPGDLREVAQTLDLPLLAVLSVSDPEEAILHLPRLPQGIDGVLVDGLRDLDDLPRVRRLLRLTGGPPILGALPELPAIRREIARSSANGHLPAELARELGTHFLRLADLEGLGEICQGRPFPDPVDIFGGCGEADRCHGLRVAYAQDEAFGRYFPDTFEALEALGAELVEFSPIRDGSLPDNVDLVMIGCGVPDQHHDRLGANHSMMAALRQHVCKGERIYTEGGGTAYLSQCLIVEGRRVPGVGIFPYEAELLAQPEPPTPVSRRLTHDSWLGAKGTSVRGYKSGRWRLTPSPDRFECPSCYGPLTQPADLLYRHHAVGSLIHLHLGALPQVVSAFAGPHRPSLRRPSLRGLADPR